MVRGAEHLIPQGALGGEKIERLILGEGEGRTGGPIEEDHGALTGGKLPIGKAPAGLIFPVRQGPAGKGDGPVGDVLQLRPVKEAPGGVGHGGLVLCHELRDLQEIGIFGGGLLGPGRVLLLLLRRPICQPRQPGALLLPIGGLGGDGFFPRLGGQIRPGLSGRFGGKVHHVVGHKAEQGQDDDTYDQQQLFHDILQEKG